MVYPTKSKDTMVYPNKTKDTMVPPNMTKDSLVFPNKTKIPTDRQDVANILANLSGIMVEPADGATAGKVSTAKQLQGLVRPTVGSSKGGLTVSPADKRPGGVGSVRPAIASTKILTVSPTEKRPGVASSVSPGSNVMLKVSPGSSNTASVKSSSVSPQPSGGGLSDSSEKSKK
eukprot:GFUD01046377.1.p1 GENE.GFUD01046377.1~~GFUD01046377.1.p1  ORF type:complete len:187 (-),score=65.96 GFUD01046377.1:177-698(-)